MTKDEEIRMLKNDNYLQAKKIKKLENEKKELMKQLKESEKSKNFWKDACMRMKGDKK